jgi:hypothetical protein
MGWYALMSSHFSLLNLFNLYAGCSDKSSRANLNDNSQGGPVSCAHKFCMMQPAALCIMRCLQPQQVAAYCDILSNVAALPMTRLPSTTDPRILSTWIWLKHAWLSATPAACRSSQRMHAQQPRLRRTGRSEQLQAVPLWGPASLVGKRRSLTRHVKHVS